MTAPNLHALISDDEPPVLGGGYQIPASEIAWLRAFGRRMLERGVQIEDVVICMTSMDKSDFSEDPIAAADGELDAWNGD